MLIRYRTGQCFSPEWRELYKHALREASRLGLEVGVNPCGGWVMGGPWTTPEKSGRWFLQSELTITGPRKFSGQLPLPDPKGGYDSKPQGKVHFCLDLPLDKADYRDTAVVAFREPPGGALLGDKRKNSLAAKSNRLDGDVFSPARQAMDQTLTPWKDSPEDETIQPSQVVDLTSKLKANGHLEWDVPTGTWTIIRTGHRMTGIRVSMSMPEGEPRDVNDLLRRMAHSVPGSDGWEVDWFSKAAVDQHWEKVARVLLADAGPLAGKTLKYFITDSFEDGYPNWTERMLAEFKRYRGYDPKPYLPVFAGRLVGSAEISDRFLYDYRRTVADCMADNHYGYLAGLARAHGLALASRQPAQVGRERVHGWAHESWPL